MPLIVGLAYNPHVDQVTKEVNKALYTLRFIRACTTEILRKRLVETCTTSLRLLYGGILGRNERSADQTRSIKQYRCKIHF